MVPAMTAIRPRPRWGKPGKIGIGMACGEPAGMAAILARAAGLLDRVSGAALNNGHQ